MKICSITEKLERIENNMFITDYIGNIVDLVKNKTDTYRILYDSKIDRYIIANSYDYTHFDMLRKAYDNGYYIDIDDYITDVSDGLHSYFHDGVYGDPNDIERTIVCYMVYPDAGTKWLYNDYYDAGYLLNTDKFRFPNRDSVVIGIKGNAFKDGQFFKAFGSPRILSRQELREDTACIASKTSYINEDELDKNGIYYFGDKPKLPISWRDCKKDDVKNFKLKERSRGTMRLLIKESIDDSGMFIQMDDAMDGLIGNVSDDDIDETVNYFRTVSGKLGQRDRYSNIQCYFSNDSWADPLENRDRFKSITPIYKNKKYDAYVIDSDYGKFIVDHYSNNFDFAMYATDEEIIRNILNDIYADYE